MLAERQRGWGEGGKGKGEREGEREDYLEISLTVMRVATGGVTWTIKRPIQIQ